MDLLDTFHEPGYLVHNEARLQHLASLNLPVDGKTVLELGAGVGDHTPFFLERGCQVTTSDGRGDSVEVLKSRYPELEVLQLDLEYPDGFNRQFEVVYCYGLLYHVRDPAAALRTIATWCSDLLLLETCVLTQPGVCRCVPEDPVDPRNAIYGAGCRPSRQLIYGTLKYYFPYVYLPFTQPQHVEFPLDWTRRIDPNQLSRAVFVASHTELQNELLSASLLEHQRHA